MNIFEKIKLKFTNKKVRPWHKYYPKNKRDVEVPNLSLYEYILNNNIDHVDDIAINYFNKKMSYRDLFLNIKLCAKAMKSQGIREGDVVSICMANTPEAVISFYAVNMLGAVCNMIHPLAAEEEIKDSLLKTNSVMLIAINLAYDKIKNIIDNTSVYKTVIVSAKDSMPTLMGIGYYLLEDRKIKTPKSNEHFINWKNFMRKGEKYNTKVLVKTTNKQSAVILHSGGTTGSPKNIVLSNGNINVVVEQAKIALPDLKRKDKMLSVLPLFHCFGLVEGLHYPLSTGQTVILVPKFDATRFDKLLTKYKPTIIPGVPTLFEAMIKNKHMDNVDLSNVKYVISGGDSLNAKSNEKVNEFLRKHNAKHNIIQGYGMTETSGGVIFGSLGSDKLGSVGIPLPGNDLKILDLTTYEELKPYEVGEILLSGPSVMQGYLDDLKATNEVLEQDDKGKVWVHTGDLGYVDEDGVLFFTGRAKRMIVSSGYNVYPGRIEEVLNEHEYILSSCVIGIPHPYKVQVPKAFIVLNENIKKSKKVEKEIKAYLKKNLSSYMIPKQFVFRESLPKTMIGKVDYRALEEEKNK